MFNMLRQLSLAFKQCVAMIKAIWINFTLKRKITTIPEF